MATIGRLLQIQHLKHTCYAQLALACNFHLRLINILAYLYGVSPYRRAASTRDTDKTSLIKKISPRRILLGEPLFNG